MTREAGTASIALAVLEYDQADIALLKGSILPEKEKVTVLFSEEMVLVYPSDWVEKDVLTLEEMRKLIGRVPLLEAIIAFARENGTELINLEVRSDNAPAVRLYRKFGFRCIGTSPAYLKIGEE